MQYLSGRDTMSYFWSLFLIVVFLKIMRFCNNSNFELLPIFSVCVTAQKVKFFIKDIFSKCDQIHSFLWIWSHLLKKSLMENFIFWVVNFLILQCSFSSRHCKKHGIIWNSFWLLQACYINMKLCFWDG